MLSLYNSLTKKKEVFQSLEPPRVGLYTCGFTVYDYAHIGSGRKYTMDDVLRRTLTYLGYDVRHVQNVTDVGHLVSDADSGEDKMEKGARKAGKTVWEIAQFFTDDFYRSMDLLNIMRPTVICKATEHIPEQIELIKTLVSKGYAYDTPEAVYFDVTRFENYGQLFGQKLEDKEVGVRADVIKGNHKKHPADFVLWVKRIGEHANHIMHWDSPWGDGFPGWHVECSAMSMEYLGETIDIHTGGEDHLAIHHPNEIAQSEAATGKPFVKYWVHHAFLLVDGQKMSKSLGNYYRVDDVVAKGYLPMSLRYLYLTTHYRKQLNFTWESLAAAQNALHRLLDQWVDVDLATLKPDSVDLTAESVSHFKQRFTEALEDDLNAPQALAVMWDMLKSGLTENEKMALLLDYDHVLGLNLKELIRGWVALRKVTPEEAREVLALVQEREDSRKAGDYSKADELRLQIDMKGYELLDTPQGSLVRKKITQSH